MNYPVGDFLIRLKNASLARHHKLEVPLTKLVKEVAKTLANEGYLDDVESKGTKLSVRLTFKRKEPTLTNIRLISKPGLRVYSGVAELEQKRGPEIFILSTPKGVMTSRQAIKKRLGGEVIAEIL